MLIDWNYWARWQCWAKCAYFIWFPIYVLLAFFIHFFFFPFVLTFHFLFLSTIHFGGGKRLYGLWNQELNWVELKATHVRRGTFHLLLHLICSFSVEHNMRMGMNQVFTYHWFVVFHENTLWHYQISALHWKNETKIREWSVVFINYFNWPTMSMNDTWLHMFLDELCHFRNSFACFILNYISVITTEMLNSWRRSLKIVFAWILQIDFQPMENGIGQLSML